MFHKVAATCSLLVSGLPAAGTSLTREDSGTGEVLEGEEDLKTDSSCTELKGEDTENPRLSEAEVQGEDAKISEEPEVSEAAAPQGELVHDKLETDQSVGDNIEVPSEVENCSDFVESLKRKLETYEKVSMEQPEDSRRSQDFDHMYAAAPCQEEKAVEMEDAGESLVTEASGQDMEHTGDINDQISLNVPNVAMETRADDLDMGKDIANAVVVGESVERAEEVLAEELVDTETQGVLESVVGAKFAVLLLESGERALLHRRRLWLGGSRSLLGQRSWGEVRGSTVSCNARRVRGCEGFQYQVVLAEGELVQETPCVALGDLRPHRGGSERGVQAGRAHQVRRGQGGGGAAGQGGQALPGAVTGLDYFWSIMDA